MKTSSRVNISLSVALLAGVAVAVVMNRNQREGIREAQHELQKWKQAAEVLNAEKKGLSEANMALYQQLTNLKNEIATLSESLRQAEQLSVENIPYHPENPDMAPDLQLTEDAWFTPPPPGMPSSAPPAVPTPSPELLEMMAQFPEHTLRIPQNQPNVIEEYLKANPELQRNRKEAEGEYGEGIESLAREHPALAEKLQKQKPQGSNGN